MKISARSVLMAGVATITASAVVLAPSVQPPPPPRPDFQLVASNQVLQQQQLLAQQQGLLEQLVNGNVATLAARIIIPPGVGTPPPTPPEIPPAPVPTSVASFIDNAYLAIEPWVSYGFEVGAWAFSWVPGIGWLAPQIWPIGYNLGERLIGSAVFNFTDWLRGEGGIITNVVDWGEDAINALIAFGIDQWNFWIGFPLPPLPGLATSETTTLMGLAETSSDETTKPGRELLDGVTAPFANSVNFGTGLLRDVIDGRPGGLEKKVGSQAVDQAVTAPGGMTIATRMKNRVVDAVKGPEAVGNTVVRTRDVRGPVGRAVTEAVDALRAGKPNKDTDEGSRPSSVAKSIGDTARKVVKDVRQAAKDARDAAKNRAADGDE